MISGFCRANGEDGDYYIGFRSIIFLKDAKRTCGLKVGSVDKYISLYFFPLSLYNSYMTPI